MPAVSRRVVLDPVWSRPYAVVDVAATPRHVAAAAVSMTGAMLPCTARQRGWCKTRYARRIFNAFSRASVLALFCNRRHLDF